MLYLLQCLCQCLKIAFYIMLTMVMAHLLSSLSNFSVKGPSSILNFSFNGYGSSHTSLIVFHFSFLAIYHTIVIQVYIIDALLHMYLLM